MLAGLNIPYNIDNCESDVGLPKIESVAHTRTSVYVQELESVHAVRKPQPQKDHDPGSNIVAKLLVFDFQLST